MVSASDQHQATQLQQQQVVLQQLNDQFSQQEAVLQSEIQRQTLVLQQQVHLQVQQQLQQQQLQLQGSQAFVVAPPARPAAAPTNNTAGPTRKDGKSVSNMSANGSAATSKRSLDGGDGQLLNGDSHNKKPKLSNDNGSADAQKDGADSGGSGGVSFSSDGSIKTPAKRSPSTIEGTDDNPTPVPSPPLTALGQKFRTIIQKLIDHEHGWVFKDPVDPVELGIPEYFTIVENPMDLTLVDHRIRNGVYTTWETFERDSKLVFENAILFNGTESDVGRMASELLDIFDQDVENAKQEGEQ